LSVVGTDRFRVHYVRKQKRDRKSSASLRDTATNPAATGRRRRALLRQGWMAAAGSVHIRFIFTKSGNTSGAQCPGQNRSASVCAACRESASACTFHWTL